MCCPTLSSTTSPATSPDPPAAAEPTDPAPPPAAPALPPAAPALPSLPALPPPLVIAPACIQAMSAEAMPADTDESPSENKRKAAELKDAGYSKKPKDQLLRSCFTIVKLEGGSVRVTCTYCVLYNRTYKNFNATKSCRAHLTNQCEGIDCVMREALQDNSQSNKKKVAMHAWR